MRVSRNAPVARFQILIVRSPAPLANHWLFGSTAKARTHPRCPEITRISFQGACHSGRCCWVADGLWTKLLGRPSPAAAPAPVPDGRLTSDIDDPLPSAGVCAWIFGRFVRPAVAFACFSARARGSSVISSYSAFRR